MTVNFDGSSSFRLRRAADDALRVIALEIRLRSDAAIPYDESFRQEALFAEWKEDQENGTKLIAKREYRKQLGRSPDLLDATCFAFWEGRVAPASLAAERTHAARVAPAMPDEPPHPAPMYSWSHGQR